MLFVRFFTFSCSVFLSTTFFFGAYAWGDLGHSAVGAIAEKNLSPKAQLWVQSILGVDALANAAIWPDQVRSDRRYAAFSPYHFFEIPVGYSFESLPTELMVVKSAHTILSMAPSELAKKEVERDKKMILLRYLVHVVGDVHQPLHIGNGVDMGANLCDVWWTDPNNGTLQVFNLHSVIDDHIFSYFKKEYMAAHPRARYFGYAQLTELLLDSKENQLLDRPSVESSELPTWYDESQALHTAIYPDSAPVADPRDRVYCKFRSSETGMVVDGNYQNTNLPTLDAGYANAVLPVIRVQLLKAGYRLAALINKMAEEDTGFSEQEARSLREARESSILNGALLELDLENLKK